MKGGGTPGPQVAKRQRVKKEGCHSAAPSCQEKKCTVGETNGAIIASK